MPGTITAYEWVEDASMHIIYQTGDNHIHEIVGGESGTWFDRDITRASGGAELENARLAGFAWINGRTQQVAYVSPMDERRQVHELVKLQNHNWTYEQPAPNTSPQANGVSLVGYDWRATGSKQIVYMDLQGHIHELAAGQQGQWQASNLTLACAAPLAEASPLSAFACEFSSSKHVAYMSGDGHIHELSMQKGATSWRHSDLTERSGTLPASGSTLIGYSCERQHSRHFFYTSNDGNIYELSAGPNDEWRAVDLMDATGAPRAVGTALAGCSWETGDTRIVAYVNEQNQLQELQADAQGDWTHTNLTHLTNAPGASNSLLLATEWSAQFAKQITYLDLRENPSLHTLTFKHSERWKHIDLTERVGAQGLV